LLTLGADVRWRQFIVLVSGAAAALPSLSLAQQQPIPIAGFLHTGSPAAFGHLAEAFREGAKSTGLIEGQNMSIEYRWAEGRIEQLPRLAKELVGRRVAVIAATGGNPSGTAAKSATATIPIVFQAGSDPVEAGFVSSLKRPFRKGLSGWSRM
jgi:putative ABC transport system substrate-binding protein